MGSYDETPHMRAARRLVTQRPSDEWAIMRRLTEDQVRRAFDIPAGIPLTLPPVERARAAGRRFATNVADAERLMAAARARDAEERAAASDRQMAWQLGEALDVRPECREWDPDTVRWLIDEYLRGDAEVRWLRQRTAHRNAFVRWLVSAVRWVRQAFRRVCRAVNGWAWPFQVVAALFGLYIVAWLFGYTFGGK